MQRATSRAGSFLASSAAVVLLLATAGEAQTRTVTFDLSNVVLKTTYNATARMTGTFTWTYPIGKFDQGVGKFTSIYIPWWGNRTFPTYQVNFDMKEIEITLVGNWHGYGLDLKLAFSTPLDPNKPSALNLARSKFDIQGRKGVASSGSIVPRSTPATPYGVGTAGSKGFVPRLDGVGLPRVGNSAFRIDADRLLGGAPCFVVVGAARAKVPMLGVDVLVDPSGWAILPMQAGGTKGVAGAGTLQVPLSIPNDTKLLGAAANFQVVVADTGSKGGQAAASNGLYVEVCR